MVFRFPNPKQLLLVISALVSSLPAHAQTLKHGQRIFFSAQNNDTATNAPPPSMTPRSPELPDMGTVVRRDFNVPVTQPAAQVPVIPVIPAITPEQAARMKQAAEKKNWALMTPAEIMGVQTPEKILGVSDEKDRDQTAVDRYLERQQHGWKEKTNAPARPYERSRDNLANSDDLMLKSSDLFPGLNQEKNEHSSSGFFNDTPNQSSSSSDHSANNTRQPENVFQSAFHSSPVAVKTPAQITADEQFQRLLTPHSASAAGASRPMSGDAPLFSSAGSAAAQPQRINPVGASYVPLSSGIQTPEGIKPLPGLIEQKSLSTTPASQDWWQSQAHLPPWMSATPQPGSAAQRRY
jgi:hypothetical protein